MAANVQHYICWKFARRLLDRVNTPLHSEKMSYAGRKNVYWIWEHRKQNCRLSL